MSAYGGASFQDDNELNLCHYNQSQDLKPSVAGLFVYTVTMYLCQDSF